MQDTNISTQLWQLEGHSCTAIFLSRDNKVPSLVWLGSRLSTPESQNNDELANLIDALTDRPSLLASPDHSPILSLLPQSATATLAMPGLLGHASGRHFSAYFELQNVRQSSSVTAEQLEFILLDPVAQLEIVLRASLHRESGTLTLSTTLTNAGTEVFELQWLASATIPLNAVQNELLTFHGRWGLEMQPERNQISAARIQIENHSGRTSHQHFPAAIAGPAGFGDGSGNQESSSNLLGMQLAWSGNHRVLAEQLSDGYNYFQIGALLQPGEIRLGAGESWTAPAAHVVAARDLNQLSQCFHCFARREILPAWSRSPRPVHANSWEALYFNHNIDQLKQLVDAAAEIGAERFVLDDGWFRHRRDDRAGLGDWFVDESIYPDGLHPLVEHVRGHGLQFGLWFEPEMVNPDSDLYRQHPDWALQVNGYETPLARSQLVLNLAKEEVHQYLYERMAALVEEYRIDYIKWDMNRNLVLAGDGQSAMAAEQPRACYRLMEQLQQQFPALEIESCSSGGARADLGILAHCGRIWSSDNIDPVERAGIQRGFSTFLPAEILGVHVGSERAHLTGRQTDIHLRAIVALQGQYGFELDARKLSEQDRRILHHYTSLYKNSREWLAEASHWRLPTVNDKLLASGNVSSCQAYSLWNVVMLAANKQSLQGALVLQGLKKGASYRIKYEALNTQQLAGFAVTLPAWMTTELVVPAELLMRIGLQLPVLPAQSGLLFSCTRVD